MQRIKWPRLILAASLGLAAAAPAAEPAQPGYNAVDFQAEAQREVQNDLLSASLYVELGDSSAAALAGTINQTVNEALRVAKEYKGVRVRSGNNQTYPVYSRSNQLQGWRGRAEIRIESRDFEAASGLIGKLQAKMQLGNISFSVAPDTRRSVEDELIVEAINAFKERAEIVNGALAGRGYKVLRLHLTAGRGVPPQPRFAMSRAASSTPEVTPPSFEAGVSQLIVTADGAIKVLEK